MDPPVPGDKYRQMAGVPAAMFLTEPDEPLIGGVLVVEGAKKGIVTYSHIDTKLNLTVVAIPSKTPSADMLEMLNKADPVYLALDPDAYWPTVSKDGRVTSPNINKIALKLNRERVIIVKLPCKPDDLFVEYGGDTADLTHFIKQGIRA
jgi:hypothetical protein